MRALIILDDDSTTIAALLDLLRDHALIPQSVVLAGEEAAPQSPIGMLTPCEAELLRWLVAGKTNREIRAALGLSEKRIEKRVSALLAKLGVTTRVAAAVRAVREGLV